MTVVIPCLAITVLVLFAMLGVMISKYRKEMGWGKLEMNGELYQRCMYDYHRHCDTTKQGISLHSTYPKPCFKSKTVFAGMDISIIKTTRSLDRLVFIEVMPILVVRRLYNKTATASAPERVKFILEVRFYVDAGVYNYLKWTRKFEAFLTRLI